MNTAPIGNRKSEIEKGFTLVELLVSTAVLTLLIMMVSQMVDSATITSTRSRRHIDADSEARMVFDRMARDFAGMVNRPDADVIFSKNTGNDTCYFMSEATSYTGNVSNASDRSTLALVGYRINTSNTYYPNAPVLERLGKTLTWDGGTGGTSDCPVFLSSQAGTTTIDTNSTIAGHWSSIVGSSTYDNGSDPNNYHVLSPAVFRIEFAFLKKDANGNYTPYVPTSVLTGSTGGLKDVAAIVVAIAVLDETSQVIVPDKTKLASSFGDITTLSSSSTPANLMAAVWKTKLDTIIKTPVAGIPKRAASSIRIYQRTFYLNPATTN